MTVLAQPRIGQRVFAVALAVLLNVLILRLMGLSAVKQKASDEASSPAPAIIFLRALALNVAQRTATDHVAHQPVQRLRRTNNMTASSPNNVDKIEPPPPSVSATESDAIHEPATSHNLVLSLDSRTIHGLVQDSKSEIRRMADSSGAYLGDVHVSNLETIIDMELNTVHLPSCNKVFLGKNIMEKLMALQSFHGKKFCEW